LKCRVVYTLILESLQLNTSDSLALPLEYIDYQDVFSKEKADELPSETGRLYKIDIGDWEPLYRPIYALSEKELKALREYLESSLEKGWIRRSVSPIGAPILFVPKKDSGLQLCVDYRGLNIVIVKNRHLLPLIYKELNRLRGAKKFTKFDLRNVYYYIWIKLGDKWKTAFRTCYSYYKY
jgi:hypothetical protein